MKKFSKIVALSMALALTFGMTVCAEVSPGTMNKWEDKAADTSATTSDGQEVKMTATEAIGGEEAVNAVSNAVADLSNSLTQQIVQAASITKASDVSLVFVLDIKPTASISGAITVTIPFQVAQPAANQKYVLMHYTATGWVPVEGASVNAEGSITFTSSSFSNYALFLVTEDTSSDNNNNNGSGNSNSNSNSNNNGGTTTTQAPASEPVSPKTGESVPVAGFAALILLAGAAVCAKKVQLNN